MPLSFLHVDVQQRKVTFETTAFQHLSIPSHTQNRQDLQGSHWVVLRNFQAETRLKVIQNERLFSF